MNDQTKLDAFDVTPYERIALMLRLLCMYFEMPTNQLRALTQKSLKEFGESWIEIQAKVNRGEMQRDTLSPALIYRLMSVASEAMDGSLIDPDKIDDDIHLMLARLQQRDKRSGEDRRDPDFEG